MRLAISIPIKLFQNNKVKKDNFIKDYGRLRYMEVCSKPCYIFSITLSSKERNEIIKSIKSLSKFEITRILNDFYSYPLNEIRNRIIIFLTAMWLVKDSCVQTNNIYINSSIGYISSVKLDIPYSMANGHPQNIALTKTENQQVNFYYKMLYPIMSKVGGNIPNPECNSEYSFIRNYDVTDRSKESSFIRAIRSVQNARRTCQLPVKIDFYMQALQCLFALEGNRSTQIEKMLASTAINILKISGENEKDVVKQNFKLAFRIRSKHTHGNKITYSDNEISAVSVKIDEYVREIIKIVFENKALDYSSKNEAKKVAKYFSNINKKTVNSKQKNVLPFTFLFYKNKRKR
ncbi:hypothetical protein HMPREF0890_0180 [Lactobacillus gasseri 202-4]|nr:hypothetical protein HMPREF0890_0180 [Lactobacillus gasseri 202-4]